MPRETRLLGYGIGSRGTRQVAVGPDGQPQMDPETGQPVMIDITELIMQDQRSGDILILPLTPEGVEVVKQAIPAPARQRKGPAKTPAANPAQPHRIHPVPRLIKPTPGSVTQKV